MLWFDVGIKRYTTAMLSRIILTWLWFDVGIKRYTTLYLKRKFGAELWFDVGIKRYTTLTRLSNMVSSCGLM